MARPRLRRPALPARRRAILGSHLLIKLFGCDGTTLAKTDTVGDAMVGAANVSEATIVADCFKFKPYGVSGAVIIQVSTTPSTLAQSMVTRLWTCSTAAAPSRFAKLLNCKRSNPGASKFLIRSTWKPKRSRAVNKLRQQKSLGVNTGAFL